MSSYLVFIPGRGLPNNDDALRAVGLGEIIDPQFSALYQDFTGPEHQYGKLVFWQDDTSGAGLAMLPSLKFEDNDWSPAKAYDGMAAGRFWLGKPKYGAITPDALARRNHLGGVSVQLDDGNCWTIPVARQLPHRYTFDDTGTPRRTVHGAYQKFYDQAQQWLDFFRLYAEEKIEPDLTQGWYFATSAVGMNYRVNQDIAEWLGLFGDVSLPMAIAATFEMAHALDDLKKNEMWEEAGLPFA